MCAPLSVDMDWGRSKERFSVGEVVTWIPDLLLRSETRGDYRIVAAMPDRDGDHMYRIRSPLEEYERVAAGLDIADEVRRLAANYLPRLTGRNAQADPEKAADGFDELGHGDRLRQIGLATAFADALLVAPHRKGGHRDHRNSLELGVLLEPLGHFEPGDFRQLNVHQDQVRTVLAGEIECLDAVARADGMVAISLQQIVKELHVELVVLHDHYCLRHLSTFWKARSASTVRGGGDPPPLKWSDLRYVFDIKEDCNG